MKAVRCCDRHPVVVDIPPPAGEGVRVKVRSAGICSSDLHMLASGFDLPGTLGHEVAGVLPDGRAVVAEAQVFGLTAPAQQKRRARVRDPETLLDWLDGHPETRFPGGEDFYTLYNRVYSGLDQMTAGKDGKKFIVVAHGGMFFSTIRKLAEGVTR